MNTEKNTLRVRWVRTPDGWQKNQQIRINQKTGRIRDLETLEEDQMEDLDHLKEVALLPGFVNAHSHAFQFGLRGHCQQADDFDDWVDSCLYPMVDGMDADEIVARSEEAFREMIQTGITCVGEFHYLHNGPDGEKRGNEIDRNVLEAARRTGLRVGFIRCFYDREGPPTRKRFLETPGEAESHYRELQEEYSDDPFVNVLPGPHSVHGATPEAARLGAELADEYSVPYHVHISEQVGEVEQCKKSEDQTPLEFLRDQDAFNRWFVGIHGCWLSEREITLLAEEGTGLVTCPTTNLTLGDGVTPLKEFADRGGTYALGSDSHQRVDLLEEARLAEWLQRMDSLEMNVLGMDASLSGTLLNAMTSAGREVLGFEPGGIEPRKPADLVAIPLETLDLKDPRRKPPSLEEIVFCKSARELVEQVWVGGEPQL